MTKCNEMPFFFVILLDPRARNPMNICIKLKKQHAVRKEINFVSVTGS
jgi:hypothetical protein